LLLNDVSTACDCTGVDVAITRTFFATTLILTTLSGHPEVMVPCLCASLVSLFITLDFPFIGPQRSRRCASRRRRITWNSGLVLLL
jgi:hypothetical protein